MDNLNKTILKIALPATLEMTVHMLGDIIGTIFAGRLGPATIAALAISGQILFSAIFVFEALGIGTTAIVARHLGAKEYQYANKAASHAIGLGIIIGVILGIMGFYGAENFVAFFSVEEEVARLAVIYLKTLSVGVPLILSLFIGSALLRGAGQTRIPFLIAILTNLLNIGLSYILIFGKLGFPKLGIFGFALGLIISLSAGCLVTLFILFRGNIIKIDFYDLFKWDFNLIKNIIKLSSPIGLEEIIFSINRIISSKLIAALGTASFAAHQIALSVESFSFMPGYGFAIAVTTLTGQTLGENKPKEAEKKIWATLKLTLYLMSAMGVLFLSAPGLLVSLFTEDPEVFSYAASCIRIGSLEQPLIAIYMVISGTLKGAGDTKSPMLISALSIWLIRVPLLYFFIYLLKYHIAFAWVITVLDWFIRSIIVLFIYKKGNWKTIKV